MIDVVRYMQIIIFLSVFKSDSNMQMSDKLDASSHI